MYALFLLLSVFLIGILIIYKNNFKITEPMIGYCLSDKPMPYHIKEVTTNNTYLAPKDKSDSIKTDQILNRKIKAIRKALEDKADWEFKKINSYSSYSSTQPNDLVIDEQLLLLDEPQEAILNPVLTQFDDLQKNYQNKKLYYKAPNNYYIFNEYGFKTYY